MAIARLRRRAIAFSSVDSSATGPRQTDAVIFQNSSMRRTVAYPPSRAR